MKLWLAYNNNGSIAYKQVNAVKFKYDERLAVVKADNIPQYVGKDDVPKWLLVDIKTGIFVLSAMTKTTFDKHWYGSSEKEQYDILVLGQYYEKLIEDKKRLTATIIEK